MKFHNLGYKGQLLERKQNKKKKRFRLLSSNFGTSQVSSDNGAISSRS